MDRFFRFYDQNHHGVFYHVCVTEGLKLVDRSELKSWKEEVMYDFIQRQIKKLNYDLDVPLLIEVCRRDYYG